jgi:post-segregation antitoxin (ccd killing protein)
MSDSKHVQTELSTDEYDYFKELARERGLSMSAALHEAIEY